MIDKRETILSRTLYVLSQLTGIETVARNRGLMDNDMRPAAVLMDGDEIFRLTGDRRGRQMMSPTLITARPQVFVVLKNRKPQNVETGEDLNAFRVALIELMATDGVLLELIGTNGNMSYEGCETDLKSGGAAEGSMRLDFAITYTLDPYGP